MSIDGRARRHEMRISPGSTTFGNEQTQLKDLNERLGIYLERVSYLEKINGEMEASIKVELEQRAANVPDWTRYEQIIKDLRQKVGTRGWSSFHTTPPPRVSEGTPKTAVHNHTVHHFLHSVQTNVQKVRFTSNIGNCIRRSALNCTMW